MYGSVSIFYGCFFYEGVKVLLQRIESVLYLTILQGTWSTVHGYSIQVHRVITVQCNNILQFLLGNTRSFPALCRWIPAHCRYTFYPSPIPHSRIPVCFADRLVT